MITSLCLLSVVLAAPAQESPKRSDLSSELERTARAAFEASDAGRLQVVVLLHGETFASLTFGPNPTEPFQASIDGALHAAFAALAMQMQDRGELDLEQEIGARLPELGKAAGSATVHELLTHTAGLHDWQEFTAATPSERLARLGAAGTLAEPGTCFQPSSGDTFALGMFLQRASNGRSATAGVLSSLFERSNAAGAGPCARREATPGLASALGEPELCASAADLAAFLQALSRRALTSEKSWSAMTSGDQLPDGTRTRYGHGLALSRLGDHERVGFGGAGGGARLEAAHYPDFELTIAVLAADRGNQRPLDAEALERNLARAIQLVPAPEIRDLPLDAEQAARFTGEYLIGCDRTIVSFRDGRLVLQLLRREPLVLLRQNEGEFVAEQERELSVRFESGAERARSFALIERGWESRAKRID